MRINFVRVAKTKVIRENVNRRNRNSRAGSRYEEAKRSAMPVATQ